MTDVANGGATTPAEKPSIEETMSAAFDKITAFEASAPAESLPEGAGLPSVEHESEQPVPSSNPDRLRGPDGKFIEKTKTAEAPSAAAPVEPNPAPTKAEPQPVVSAPTSWAADKRALLDKADPALRDYVALREKQQQDGVAKLKAEYEGKLGNLAPIAEALRPVEARLKVNNIHPAQYVSNLAAADEALRTNPQQAIREIARMYGIDLGSVQAGAQQGYQAPLDPNLAALQQRLEQTERFLNSRLQAEQQEKQTHILSLIERFKSDPANEHYEAVEADMLPMVSHLKATRPELSPDQVLKEAYDRAVHANPETRAKVFAAQQTAQEATRKAEAEKKASEARRVAQTNVATRGTVGASPSTPKSMEETIRQAADRIYSAA
jgi:hypothetical protein